MTINLADNSPRISYAVAQGATQTSFAVPFEFFADADLNVYVDGTLKTLTTHYTVSGGDGSTGTVTISVTGATGGSTVVITRDVALERTTDFPSSGPFQIGALNTELDRLTAIAADLDDKAGRALQVTDYDVATGLTLPEVNDRKGKTLAFNASSGAVEAGPTISDVQTVSAAAADIQTLAHIEDGTDATDAIQTVAGIASNVSTVAGVSSAVSTVAGISSNVTAVAADATDIGAVAGKATEIGRLGTADAVSDLNTLGTADAVSDMNTLAAISSNISTVAGISANVTSVAGVASLITSDFVADLNTLATTDIVSDLNTLATADIVSDLNTLATSDIVSDLNTLATADIVSDLNTLATTDIVSDLNTLATTDIVTDLNLLATSAIVEDLNLLATSTVIADMATLAGAGANPNISSLGVSGNITLADNGKAIFGAGSDLEVFHDGSASNIIDTGTGNLFICGSGAIHFMNPAQTEYYASFNDNGAVDLRYDNSIKLATTSTGVNITGTASVDNLLVDNAGKIYSLGQIELQVDTDNNQTGTYIGFSRNNTTSERLAFFSENGDISFYEDTGTTPKFFWDASAESLGIGTSAPVRSLSLFGTLPAVSFHTSTSGSTSSDGFQIQANSTDVYLWNYENTPVRFATNGTERMRISAEGNVGIGEAPSVWRSADRALVVGNGASQYGNYVSEGLGVTYGSGWYRDTSGNFKYTLTGYPAGRFDFNYTGANVFSWHQAAAGTAGNNISFSEAIRLDASGNLLVGETSAVNNGDITLARSATDANISLLSRSTTDSQGCAIQMQKSSTNSGNFAATADGENLGAIVFRGVNTSAVSKEGAQITVIQDGTNASTVPAAMKFATGGTERMRIISQGALQVSDTGSYRTWSSNITGNQFIRGDAGQVVLTADATSTGYTNDVMRSLCNRSSSSSYEFFTGTSGNLGDDEFRLRGDGNAYADGSWNGGGADYAEYFEWADGNAADEDRVGLTVVLDGNQIRKATSSDDASSIIGAVSANPSVVGDTDIGAWKHKYLRDDFGRYIRDTHNVVEWTETVSEEDGQEREIKHSYEDWNIPADVTVPEDATTSAQDQNGNPFDHKRPNPDYDPARAYVSREDRPEWATIGMMGKLRILKGQPTGSNWIKMRDVSDTVEEWLVR